jgi:hypothetical protein
MEYPIIGVIGIRGSGKTLLTTGLANMYHNQGKHIIANYDLYDIPFRKASFSGCIKNFDKLYDSVLVFDEIQVGAHAYDFYRKGVRALASLAEQMRKRRIILYFTSQHFKKVAVQIRRETNYIILPQMSEINGVISCNVYDQNSMDIDTLVNTFIFDGRPYFDKYDTDEIVRDDAEIFTEVMLKTKKDKKIIISP